MDKANVDYVMLRNVNKELVEISERGLSNSNLELAYKLIEMKYRLVLLNKMDVGKNDIDYDYQISKQHYRINKCSGTQAEVLQCLKNKINSVAREVQELWNDSDMQEERELIKKFFKLGE